MNLQLNVYFFVALVLILNLTNGRYLLVEVDGAEETNEKTARNDCKGTSCDVTRIVKKDQCLGKKCGESCKLGDGGMGGGVCSGGQKGYCVSVEMNPCSCHGCKDCGLQCGEECLVGDMMGWCSRNSTCEFSETTLDCDDKLLRSDKDRFDGISCPSCCQHGCFLGICASPQCHDSSAAKKIIPKNGQCLRLCEKPGETDECTKNTVNRRDENGCLSEVCYTRGTCGPLLH